MENVSFRELEAQTESTFSEEKKIYNWVGKKKKVALSYAVGRRRQGIN